MFMVFIYRFQIFLLLSHSGNSLNWNTPAIPDFDHIENLGFFAFGVSGVFRGCAISTFIFVGLDFVHKTKNRPTTFFGFVWYLIASLLVIATGIIISMLFPYYLLVCTKKIIFVVCTFLPKILFHIFIYLFLGKMCMTAIIILFSFILLIDLFRMNMLHFLKDLMNPVGLPPTILYQLVVL